MSKTTARHFRIWIFDGSYETFDSGFDQSFGARLCAALVRVRLERNISRSPACAFACLLERSGFGVLDLIEEVKALADNFTHRINNHRADQRPGTNLPDSLRGQLERARHHSAIRFSPL
jgi:hypothetical protein